MAPPVIAKGPSFTSKGISNLHGELMIHAMAEYIWYNGRMWNYRELLVELDRGIHFAILPCGQVIQFNDPRSVLWQARGANHSTCAVELLVPGVFDLDALYSKINSTSFLYPAMQYDGLFTVMNYLYENLEYVMDPVVDWQLHHEQSKGRKKDPGSSFDIGLWKGMLREQYGE